MKPAPTTFSGPRRHLPAAGGSALWHRRRQWYENLDFTDLSRNAQWAAWVYDNPGVDTDGDGCAGLMRAVNCRDTIICGYYGCKRYEIFVPVSL